MTKDHAKVGIRWYARDWWMLEGSKRKGEAPSFLAFREWLERENKADYLKFRSRSGPLDDAERWFQEELGQVWRD